MLPRPTIRLEDAYVRSTYSPTWRRTYDEQGLVHIDRDRLRIARTRATPLIWSPDIFKTRAAAFHVARKPARTDCAPV
ncbi:autoinducer binding domain-containing protein [Paraburkholderia dipogonis]|uniref:autoinducer binding domain-containing protein n=1 Tax=Paraburkholderia dipogonis TaxID=1211383 RepID=UPI0035EFC7C8